MKPTRKEVLELEDAWRGNFGRFLRALLIDHQQSAQEEGAMMMPASQYEMTEREQTFGKSKAFKELLEIIPQKLKELNSQTQDQNE